MIMLAQQTCFERWIIIDHSGRSGNVIYYGYLIILHVRYIKQSNYIAFLIYHIRYISTYLPTARLVLGTTAFDAAARRATENPVSRPFPKWQHPPSFRIWATCGSTRNRITDNNHIHSSTMRLQASPLPLLTLRDVGGHPLRRELLKGESATSHRNQGPSISGGARRAENGTH